GLPSTISCVLGKKAEHANREARYAQAPIRMASFRPIVVPIIGTKTAPMTEKQPLIPQAQTNRCSLPRLASVVMAMGIGNPIKTAAGSKNAKQQTIRSGSDKGAIQLSIKSIIEAYPTSIAPITRSNAGNTIAERLRQPRDRRLPTPEQTSMPVITTAAAIVLLLSANINFERNATSIVM